jgi:hypothetical protein
MGAVSVFVLLLFLCPGTPEESLVFARLVKDKSLLVLGGFHVFQGF